MSHFMVVNFFLAIPGTQTDVMLFYILIQVQPLTKVAGQHCLSVQFSSHSL